MYWAGSPILAFGPHGWMPKPLPSKKVGALLADPIGKKVMMAVARIIFDGGTGPEIEAWAKEEFKKMNAPGTRVGVEFMIATKPVSIHDSRHYGQASIALASDEPAEKVTFVLEGQKEELPCRDGEHKVIKHTLKSQFGDYDIYLAVRLAVSADPTTSKPAE